MPPQTQKMFLIPCKTKSEVFEEYLGCSFTYNKSELGMSLSTPSLILYYYIISYKIRKRHKQIVGADLN